MHEIQEGVIEVLRCPYCLSWFTVVRRKGILRCLRKSCDGHVGWF